MSRVFSDEEKTEKVEDIKTERKKLETELQKLINEQKILENRLQELEQQIKHTETIIQTKMSPERARLLRELKESKKLAQMYSKKVLSKYMKLQQEIESRTGGLEYFCLEIETWLENLYDAIYASHLAFLEPSRYELYLLNNSYENASAETYQALFEIIKKDLCRQTGEEEEEDLNECIDFLEDKVLRFYR